MSPTSDTHRPLVAAHAVVGDPTLTTSGAAEVVALVTSPQPPPWLAPRLEGACHVAMCVTMGYMLVLML
jgi:hypothetical protein